MTLTPDFKFYFKQRFAEWVSGTAIFIWGYLILGVGPQFNTVPIFISMNNMAPYYIWATYAMFVGFTKILFLLINGTWRRSVHLRTIGSVLSVTLWAALLISYIGASYVTPNSALVGALISADIFALWNSSAEAKRSDLTGGIIRGNFDQKN